MRHYLAAKHNEDGLRTPNEKSLNPFVPNAAFLYPFSPFQRCFPGVQKGYICNKCVNSDLRKTVRVFQTIPRNFFNRLMYYSYKVRFSDIFRG